MTDHIIYGLMTSAGLTPEPEKPLIFGGFTCLIVNLDKMTTSFLRL